MLHHAGVTRAHVKRYTDRVAHICMHVHTYFITLAVYKWPNCEGVYILTLVDEISTNYSNKILEKANQRKLECCVVNCSIYTHHNTIIHTYACTYMHTWVGYSSTEVPLLVTHC